MRLIDADALVTVQSYDPMNEESSQDEMTVADALDFATEEGCPPIIDAIPVEWLREFDLYYAGFSGGTPYMNELVKAWQRTGGIA